jgi:RNA polymerase sigma-70 factor, ECF subfamily
VPNPVGGVDWIDGTAVARVTGVEAARRTVSWNLHLTAVVQNHPEERSTMDSQKRAHFDRDYIERLKSGDAETERHFTRYFGDLITAKLRSRLRSPAAREDAKQETFLRVLAALRGQGRLATPEALGAFVNSVCNNVLFEIYRKQCAPCDNQSEPTEDIVEDRPNAESLLMRAELRAHVREVLSSLPSKDRQLLHWLFAGERDKNEICRSLGINRGYLRVRLHRAKARFRDEFECSRGRRIAPWPSYRRQADLACR